ncbi:hypothetical protein [Halorientalis pallida]|uniref:Uncharacterized protein n=1 Tax=Halorientalis pallida TaxID=2479928 RepID=A0A498KXT6_9EURY|nr:hypothetical protein [Halorientalis pallida]RXK46935.1 hypothetical protein EAF64_17465 [Halorientalis pallida]
MREKVVSWNKKPSFRRTVSLSIVFVIVSGPFQWLLSFTPFVGGDPSGAVLVIGSLLWGPAAVLGVMVGAVVTDLVIGALSIETLCRVPALGLASITAYTVWGRTRPETKRGDSTIRSIVRNFAAYAAVAVVSLSLFAAVLGWALELLSLSAFSIAAPTQLATVLPLAVVAFPLWAYLEQRVAGRDTVIERIAHRSEHEWGRYRWGLFVVTPVAWVVVGTVVSFVFRATGLVPAERIGRRLTPLATVVLELAGPRGTRIQLLGGGVALLIFLWVFWGKNEAAVCQDE